MHTREHAQACSSRPLPLCPCAPICHFGQVLDRPYIHCYAVIDGRVPLDTLRNRPQLVALFELLRQDYSHATLVSNLNQGLDFAHPFAILLAVTYSPCAGQGRGACTEGPRDAALLLPYCKGGR